MAKSKIFLYFCLAFIGGIALGSFVFVSQAAMLGILISGIFLISVFWKSQKLAVIGFCLIFFAAGIWRCQQAQLKIVFPEEKNIAFIGKILEEPEIRENNVMKLIIKPVENDSRFTEGKILVTTNRYPEYRYGDKLKIVGRLEIPQPFKGFNYKNYLVKDGIYSVIYWPKIELISRGQGNLLINTLLSFKKKYQEAARQYINPPQVGILEALFSGDEGSLSKEWKNKLNVTGTRHIAAVSGMNITLIAFLIMSFALSLGIRKKRALCLSMLLLALYILMIGAPASAVRAGIMAFLLMTAQALGRFSSASRGVFFAAALMLALNPLLLKLDVGFQLSFLAIFGLIYLQPIFSKWLRKIPDPGMFPAKTTLSATLAAQFFTLPILVYNFGYIPLFSLITNLLIVPFLAPITVMIFIFGISAILFGPLGFLLSLPVWFSLTYVVTIINLFSRFSSVSLTIQNLHWAWLITAYLALGCFAWRLNRKKTLNLI